MIQKTPIVIDFDGTICEHKFPDIGEPTPDVREALETLKKAGYRIIIHTCRTGSYWKGIIPGNQPKLIEGFMKYHTNESHELEGIRLARRATNAGLIKH